MADPVKELLEDIRRARQKREELKKTECGQLIHRIVYEKKTDDEWLKLQEDVRSFIKTNPSKEDLQALSGYTESLYMICKGIQLKRQENIRKGIDEISEKADTN